LVFTDCTISSTGTEPGVTDFCSTYSLTTILSPPFTVMQPTAIGYSQWLSAIQPSFISFIGYPNCTWIGDLENPTSTLTSTGTLTSSSGSTGLSTETKIIIAVVVPVATLFLLLGFAFFWYFRRKRARNQELAPRPNAPTLVEERKQWPLKDNMFESRVVPAAGAPAYGVPAYGVPAYGVPAYGEPAYGVQPDSRHELEAHLRPHELRGPELPHELDR
jgi:hypothetical protein